MKSITRFLSLLILMMMALPSLEASHYKGGEASFESLGGCNYRITVTEYYDCSGVIATPNQPTGGLQFYDAFAVSNSGTALSAWTLVSDSEVINLSPLNSIGGTSCTGGSILGVRKFVFQRDYGLCGITAPIKINFEACCRGGAVTNVAGSGMQTYQYSTDIEDASLSNTSPTWLDPSFTIIPAGFNTHRISMAAYDAEGDSLSYNIDTVFTSAWQSISYFPGYSFTQPFGGGVSVYLEPSTGNLNLSGVVSIGEYAIGLKVSEYRNGVLLSTSRRDFTVMAANLTSNLATENPIIPWFSLPAPTNGTAIDSVTISTTVGANLVLPLSATTTLPGEIIDMTWSHNLPGGQLYNMNGNFPADTIIDINPTGELRWTPTAPGRYAFNVKLRNDSQPVWSMSDVSYVITVAGTPIPCTLTADIGPDSIEICGGSFAMLNSSLAGGSAPFVYTWSTGETTANIQVNVTGTYILQVNDLNNCIASDTVYVNVGNLSVDIGPDTVLICDGDTAQFAASVSGGAIATYLWSPGSTTSATYSTPTPGTVALLITDMNACTASDTAVVAYSPYCVWPGDADNDLIADNNDLLAVGLTYGDVGPVRPGATLNWEAQQGSAWATSLPGGLNAVFTDTDGNGIVNDDDTLAINLNYGQTHLKGNTAMAGIGDPLLYLTTANDSVGAGETLNISINLGVDTLTADNIYGLAFTVQYNNAVVDSFSAHVSYNGWLGTYGTNMLGIQKDFFNDGEVDVALVRNDQQIATGFGMIANLSIVMIDDIAGKTAVSEILALDLIDVRVIGLDGEEIPVNTEGTQVVVTSGGANSIEDELAKTIRIYPQPAQDLLFIEIDEPQNWEATLYTLSGQQLSSVSTLRGTQETIDLSTLANGLYILRVKTDQGIISKKVMIAR
ncbi:MAG: T9SS type A sorting domain-containing protein [Bacteroidia bacterium]